MLKNYITETNLKGFVPELAELLWTGLSETNYNKQKLSAEQIVMADFIDRDYQARNLRPELEVTTSTPDTDSEDIGNRFRAVAICTTFTGTATATISGSNDVEDTFVSCGTSDSLAVGTNSWLLTEYFKFYKYALTGTATITSVSLVEASNYDLMYAYKWLELILKDASSQPEDVYDLKSKWFAEKYQDRWKSFSPFYDEDEDGVITSSEKQSLIVQTIQH